VDPVVFVEWATMPPLLSTTHCFKYWCSHVHFI